MTRLPRSQHDGVLAGVKATPCGWPSASLGTDSGAPPVRRERERGPEDQDPPISGLYGFRGLPRHRPATNRR
jgi:hypothetical protein